MTVKKAWHPTPNMIRVTFAGPELTGFPVGSEGGNCKLLLPEAEEAKADFEKRIVEGKPVRRTFTVRHFRPDSLELDIDFVDHGDNGPASSWANRATAGSFLGFMGPSSPKVSHFEADWYLIAADASAIPVAAAALEAMPRDAKGLALFEVASNEDRQDINAPTGVEIRWLVQPEKHVPCDVQPETLMATELPQGRIQTCIAGESGVIKRIRDYLREHADLRKQDTYISGYWKHGLVEDEHQKVKRQLA
ncbi:MAG: siderophore-interacting protein [Pseudomonadota bacterium]